MKLIFSIPVIFSIISCSSINVEQTSPLSFDRLFIAKVEGRKEISLEPNESKSGRVFVGLISAGPMGAIATANTEEGFSRPKAFEYSLLIEHNKSTVIMSRSIAEVGSCVEVISPDDSKIELLQTLPLDRCPIIFTKPIF